MDRAVTCRARGPEFDPRFIQKVSFLSGRMEPDTLSLRDQALPKNFVVKQENPSHDI